MNWTEDKPTIDGWYWWRHPLHKDEHIAKISSRRAEFVGDKHIYNLDILKGEWLGPMLVPASTSPTYAQGQEEMKSRAIAAAIDTWSWDEAIAAIRALPIKEGE